MSFSERLKKFTALGLSAVAPRGPFELCHPQMILLRGAPMGLMHMELAPMVVGGAEALHIIEALVDLQGDIANAPDGLPTSEQARELADALEHLRQHLKSVSAAARLAHAEYQVLTRAERGTLQ